MVLYIPGGAGFLPSTVPKMMGLGKCISSFKYGYFGVSMLMIFAGGVSSPFNLASFPMTAPALSMGTSTVNPSSSTGSAKSMVIPSLKLT